jgi:hypothetical protein
MSPNLTSLSCLKYWKLYQPFFTHISSSEAAGDGNWKEKNEHIVDCALSGHAAEAQWSFILSNQIFSSCALNKNSSV